MTATAIFTIGPGRCMAMPQKTEILTAQWVAPMTGMGAGNSLMEQGAVVYSAGRVLAAGSAASVTAHWPDAQITDLGSVVLMPGLVNAHVHLELTGVSVPDGAWLEPGSGPPCRPERFVDWLLAVMAQSPPPGDVGASIAAERTAAGIAQCLKFGVTAVGDITRFPDSTRRVLASSPMRAVSFGEVTAMAGRRHLLAARLAAAMTPAPEPDRIISAVSPHAPYSIELDGYKECAAAAAAAGVPLATHLAESPDELEFLVEQTGPFRRLWSVIGGWDESVPRLTSDSADPKSFAESAGLLSRHDDQRAPASLLVHMNYAHDLVLPAGSVASVVYCPRTHAYFGHPRHPFRAMLERGINVAVGTDSTASSPDLNLVDDLRLIRRIAPDFPPRGFGRWQRRGRPKR